MSAIVNAIAALEQQLAGLDDKRGQIEHALTALRRLESEGLTPVGRLKATALETRPPAARTKAARLAKSDGDPSVEKVLAILRRAGGPMSPGDLASAVGMTTTGLRAQLKAMVKRKQIVVTGATINRRVALSGNPTKEVP